MTGGAFAAVADAWTDSTDDRMLVRSAQEDAGEFAAIYTRYGRPIYLYVRARVSSDDDAMDITQQIFVKAFKALPKYQISQAPLSAWLFRIARNAIVDQQRRHRPTADIDAIPQILAASGPGPEEEALRGEEIGRLRRALLGLDAQKRELLALRYAGGLRISEIAHATGKSEEATKKRLVRALQTLRKCYAEAA